MKFWKAIGLIFTVLFLTGVGLRYTVEQRAWERMVESEPALDLANLEGVVGQGIIVGLLGGFRGIIADFLWIRTNHHWEQDDIEMTHNMIRLVTTIDPRPDFFWFNGARMIGYDMPHWRIMAEGGYERVSSDRQYEINEELSARALRLLDRAIEFHPENPRFLVEKANIYQRRLDRKDLAKPYWFRAAEMPGAPYYAARIYAEVLRDLEMYEEAYEWLVDLHPTLPPDVSAAMATVVLERIRILEDQLGIPFGERYQEPEPETES